MPEVTLNLPTEDHTITLAQALAETSRPGDCLLLTGEIGSGKSFLARAFIRSLAGVQDLEVPSPTFTLVQTYELGNCDVWHADLYRLTDPQEAIELGLIDAFDTAITVIEWPELLGEMIPPDALRIALSVGSTNHKAVLTFSDAWTERLKGFVEIA
ncbi:MAG: tRNA (adenosine(37)-N6)-threonylcarbamoyltransferase complex ATPase subunit type 1 TsaE [Pseudomonadota bacterium]